VIKKTEINYSYEQILIDLNDSPNLNQDSLTDWIKYRSNDSYGVTLEKTILTNDSLNLNQTH